MAKVIGIPSGTVEMCKIFWVPAFRLAPDCFCQTISSPHVKEEKWTSCFDGKSCKVILQGCEYKNKWRIWAIFALYPYPVQWSIFWENHLKNWHIFFKILKIGSWQVAHRLKEEEEMTTEGKKLYYLACRDKHICFLWDISKPCIVIMRYIERSIQEDLL